jgi:hypothetical protein
MLSSSAVIAKGSSHPFGRRAGKCVVNRVVKVLNEFVLVRLDFERLACVYEGKPLYFTRNWA